MRKAAKGCKSFDFKEWWGEEQTQKEAGNQRER